jgi:orotidine-5'-phosphate decarboxylase
MNLIPKLLQKIRQTSNIVVGLDPNLDLFCDEFKVSKISSNQDLSEVLLDFCVKIIDSTFDLTPAIKIQIAYFEQLGLVGLEILVKVIKYAKSKDLLVIMDAKRGDISDTAKAYASSFLDSKIQINSKFSIKNSFCSDFLTINPFLGLDSLEPFIEKTKNQDVGLFVLVKTSNPGSTFLQNKLIDNQVTVSEKIAKLVNKLNLQTTQKNENFGLVGAVIGATHPQELLKFRKIMPKSLFLVPGVGSQGASLSDIKKHYSNKLDGLIIPISRAIIYPKQNLISKIGFSKSVRENLQEFIQNSKE